MTKEKCPERLVVIDGNHLIHRAFHAIQAPLRTSRGEQTNALFGFASMLLNIIDLEKPDYLAMTFDEKAPTFRHDAHEGYKATRAKAPDELYAQIPRIKEMVTRFKLPIYSKEGFEADDMMGTLARHAEKEGIESCVVTGDMDLLQMTSPNIRVVFPHKGYKEPIVYDAAKVKEKYGVDPNQIVDYKALVGDSSDNYGGVHGVGPKGATELLNRYHTLNGIYEHLGELSENLRKKLEDGKESAYFAQKLAQLITDVPCQFSKEDMSVDRLDFSALQKFFEEMEMKSLVARLKKTLPSDKLQAPGQMAMF